MSLSQIACRGLDSCWSDKRVCVWNSNSNEGRVLAGVYDGVVVMVCLERA